MPDDQTIPNNEASSSPPKDHFADAKAHARQAAEELRAAAEAKARELRDAAEVHTRHFRETAAARVQEFRGRAEQAYGDARVRSETMQEEGAAFVREHPGKALVLAILTGFFLGAFFRGR